MKVLTKAKVWVEMHVLYQENFSGRFFTIIQGKRKDLWLAFDTDFIKRPKGLDCIDYDCKICSEVNPA